MDKKHYEVNLIGQDFSIKLRLALDGRTRNELVRQMLDYSVVEGTGDNVNAPSEAPVQATAKAAASLDSDLYRGFSAQNNYERVAAILYLLDAVKPGQPVALKTVADCFLELEGRRNTNPGRDLVRAGEGERNWVERVDRKHFRITEPGKRQVESHFGRE